MNINTKPKAQTAVFSQHGKHSISKNKKKLASISVNDFDGICRFCLVKSPEVKLITSDQDNLLYEQCVSVLTMTIDRGDNLPSNICKRCENIVLKFHEFKQSVLEVQQILTNILKGQNDILTGKNVSNEFSNEENKQEIIEKQEMKGKYKCRFCNSVFNKGIEYKTHLKMEREKRLELYSCCAICNKLLTKGKLKAHMKMHTRIKDEQNYQCDICGKNYRTKRNLNRHSLVHTGMPHVCEICGKGFREANLLKDHLNTHLGLTPHLCSVCGSSYPTSSALRLHKAYKHIGKKRKVYIYPKKGDKNHVKTTKRASFPCEVCGKVYASKTIVNYHVLTHSGERNFQCNDCGKMFANRSTLGDHRRIHRLSYKCKYCDRSFAYAASLETHINSHTGQKPHECNFCEKRYSNKSHLKEHIRSHTGERPYSCTICGKTFAVKGNFNVHMKTHKNDDAGIN